MLVGTGPSKRQLRELARANVYFVGDVTDAQLRWLYANCVGLIAA